MLFVRNPTGVSHSPEPRRPRCRTAWPACTRWPRPSSGWRREHVVPARAGLGRRRRPRRRAGRDRGRPVHPSRPDRRKLRVHRELSGPTAGETARLPGLTIPGLANCHSHAFHRALRGRTQRERGTFWTWREQMYAVAGRLTPTPTSRWPGRPTARWWRPAYTSVGEFHYLHHRPDGTPYDDPNAMGQALERRRTRPGSGSALLDTCYLSQRLRRSPPEGVQRPVQRRGRRRAWAGDAAGRRTGRDPLGARGAARPARRSSGAGRRCTCTSPSRSPRTTPASRRTASPRPGCCTSADAARPGHHGRARHPPHRRRHRAARRRPAPTSASPRPPSATSPTASGPPRGCTQAGCRITLGSDSHAVIDPFEELRGLEMDERLATQERGHWTAAELLDAATGARRARASRTPAASRSAQRADLVTLDTDEPADRGHRRGRAHRGVRGHRGRRRPGGRRRSGRLHAGRRRGDRPRARRARSEHCGQHPDHPHRRAGHQRPRRRRPARSDHGRRARRRGQPGRLGRPGGRRPGRGRGRRRRRPRGAARASSTATATWSSPATGPRSSRRGWRASRTPPAASAPRSPPPAPPPTSS